MSYLNSGKHLIHRSTMRSAYGLLQIASTSSPSLALRIVDALEFEADTMVRAAIDPYETMVPGAAAAGWWNQLRVRGFIEGEARIHLADLDQRQRRDAHAVLIDAFEHSPNGPRDHHAILLLRQLAVMAAKEIPGDRVRATADQVLRSVAWYDDSFPHWQAERQQRIRAALESVRRKGGAS